MPKPKSEKKLTVFQNWFGSSFQCRWMAKERTQVLHRKLITGHGALEAQQSHRQKDLEHNLCLQREVG